MNDISQPTRIVFRKVYDAERQCYFLESAQAVRLDISWLLRHVMTDLAVAWMLNAMGDIIRYQLEGLVPVKQFVPDHDAIHYGHTDLILRYQVDADFALEEAEVELPVGVETFPIEILQERIRQMQQKRIREGEDADESRWSLPDSSCGPTA